MEDDERHAKQPTNDKEKEAWRRKSEKACGIIGKLPCIYEMSNQTGKRDYEMNKNVVDPEFDDYCINLVKEKDTTN